MFEIFEINTINSFELDPAHYLSAVGYYWDAMLRLTDVLLKLISDIENYQFIESAKMGGISVICKGYSEANNKFLKSYDSSKTSKYIMYLDANYLYGNSMMQLLPIKILD